MPETVETAPEEKAVVKDEDVMGGAARIAGTRIRVSDIVVKYNSPEYSVADIVEAYPSIDRSDVHAALTYYYRNREEVDREIRRNRETSDKLREELPSYETASG